MATMVEEVDDRRGDRGQSRHPLTISGGQPGLGHRENEPGVKKQHVNGKVQIIFAGEAYLRCLGYLTGQYTDFASRDIGWTPAYAAKMASRGLGVADIIGHVKLNADTISLIMKNHDMERRLPTAILFREETAKPGDYLAMAAQRMFFPRVRLAEGQVEREEPVLYGVLRAIAENKRGEHMGRDMVESGLILHRMAKWFTHRTPYDVAAYTNTQSDALDQEGAHPWLPREPWTRPFTDDKLAWAVEQEMSRILGNPVPVDEWGICRDLYPEPNINVDNINRPEHEGRARIWDFMYVQQKMTTKDGILPLYRVR